MAYVAISGNTISVIRDRIVGMRNKELKNLGTNVLTPSSVAVNKDAMLQQLWGEDFDKRDSIPVRFKKFKYSFYFVAAHNGTPMMFVQDMSLQQFRMYAHEQFDTRVVPLDAEDSGYHTIKTGMDVLKVTRASEEDIEKHNEYITRFKQVVEKWDGIIKQVVDFLGKCKSLNQALKVMPTFRLYVPADLLEKIDEKVERAPTKGKGNVNPLEGMDITALTQAAVTARILGG